tara:strand:+ start:502 stop:705 length:204 start_codon:yes stop_codon:yes gene_type:complete
MYRDNSKPSDQGFIVKDGRLINDSKGTMCGLTKAAIMRKDRKRAEKVRMIAEGNELSRANLDLFKKL